MVKHFRLCRAREEITRLNVEIRRLRTFIHDETIHTNKTIKLLTQSNPPLSTELRSRWQLRNAINDLHIQRLDLIEGSAIFTGLRGIGTRLSTSTPPTPSTDNSVQVDTTGDQGSASGSGGDDEAAEDGGHDLEKITDFILTITD
jgi:hypothetical protein